MKIWKKVSLLLCACVAFSSVAASCDFLGLGNSSTASSSSSSKKPSSSSSSSGVNIDVDDEDIIDIYLAMVAGKLDSTQSAKLTFNLATTVTASGTNGVTTVGGWTNYTISGAGIVTKTDDGYNAKLDVQVPSEENAGQTEAKTYYYVDGYVYEYVTGTNVYKKYDQTLEEMLDNLVHATSQGAYSLETLLGTVAGGGILNEDMDLSFSGLQEGFADYAVIEGEITDTGMKLSADATEKADELFDFLRTVNEKTTYAELLNYYLKQISPDLTTAKVFTELYAMGPKTVSDVVAELDEISITETGKTLQEKLNEILKDESLQQTIKDMLLSGENAENTEINAALSYLFNFNIQEFLETESEVQDRDGNLLKYGEITFNQLAKEIVNGLISLIESVPEIGDELRETLISSGLMTEDGTIAVSVNWAMLVSMVESLSEGTPLTDLEEGDKLYEVLETVKAVEVSKTDMHFELKVNETAFESITLLGSFTGNADKDGLASVVGATADILVSEFSEQRVEISIPQDATIEIVYEECVACGEAKESVSYREDAYDYYCEDCYAEQPDAQE